MATETEINAEPIFILTLPRSGSTLLRYILDTHEGIHCPPELHLGKLMENLYDRINVLNRGAEAENYKSVSQYIQMLMHTAPTTKPIWCDKSVTSISHIATITKVFPNARYICLYRHCLDFVHSALEVIMEGREGFGFEAKLSKKPAQLINSLVEYWCEETEKIVQFDEVAFRKLNVRYESVIDNPSESIAEIFRFLDLDVCETHEAEIFARDHQPGNGDHKIVSTSEIRKDRVGKGFRLNLNSVSCDNVARMNRLLIAIGYEEFSVQARIAIPSHFEIGRNNSIVKDHCTSIAHNLVDFWSSKLEQRVGKSDNSCFIKIRDLPGACYKLSFVAPFVTETVIENHTDENIIGIDLYELLDVVDQRKTAQEVLISGNAYVHGDINVINEFAEALELV